MNIMYKVKDIYSNKEYLQYKLFVKKNSSFSFINKKDEVIKINVFYSFFWYYIVEENDIEIIKTKDFLVLFEFFMREYFS